MKKIIITLLYFFVTLSATLANVVPCNVSDIPSGSLGVYQTTTALNVYSKPAKTASIVYNLSWSYLNVSTTSYADNLFAVLNDKKELSFVYATDIDEDFVQIIYDKKNRNTGWVVKEDNFQFLPWISFYNMYGRKYGLKLLKGYPPNILDLHSASHSEAQVIAKLNRPKEIRLTTIQGNWALITALDIDGVPKTGFIRWRSDNGELYLFPVIK